MATRIQKRQGVLIGGMLAGAAAVQAKVPERVAEWQPTEQAWVVAAMATAILVGAVIGFWLVQRLGARDDTVVYMLRRRGRIVYVGVAYARRMEGRIAEHRRSGKVFDRVDIGRARPRKEALQIEARKIRSLQPRYNVAGK
ncbi:MAG: hypothetical protein AAF570_09640 [Bacteroidota bacterium]